MKKIIAAAFCVLLSASAAVSAAEELLCGDVNGDRIVDGRDASAVLSEYALQSSDNPPAFTYEQMKAADVNSDGVMDGRDATIILTYYARTSSGLKTSFEKYLDSLNKDIVDSMTLHDKICQMFIVRPEELTGGTDMTSAAKATHDSLEEYPVGGLIYFSNNMESRAQVTEMIAATRKYAEELDCVPLFFSVDELQDVPKNWGRLCLIPCITIKQKAQKPLSPTHGLSQKISFSSALILILHLLRIHGQIP